MTAITSAGSGENIQLLKNREADLAIIQSLYGTMAWEGKGRYRAGPEQYIRVLTVLWENAEHFAVLKKFVTSGDISDLKKLRKCKHLHPEQECSFKKIRSTPDFIKLVEIRNKFKIRMFKYFKNRVD